MSELYLELFTADGKYVVKNSEGKIVSDKPMELKEAAAMFAPILVSQAQKRYPMVIAAQKKIEQVLQNSIPAQSLEQDLDTLQKALECRQSDIVKAQDTGREYFMKLL